MKQMEGDFQERQKTKSVSTAGFGPSPSAAAEQKLKGSELKDERTVKADELLAERNLTHEELLALHLSTKKLLVQAQAKNKDLLEAVRYRDRKIQKLGPGVAGTGKVVGSNTMDHSHLGEAVVVEKVTAQANLATKAVTAKTVAPSKKAVVPKN